jgi:putative flippase GtrA
MNDRMFRVHARILRFACSSLAAAALDFMLLFTLKTLTGNLLASVVAARVASATANYALNRSLVFRTGEKCPTTRSLPRYAALAAVLLSLNYGCLHALTTVVGLPLLPAKLLTEAALYALSYGSQRRYVFAPARTEKEPTTVLLQDASSVVPVAQAVPARRVR